MTDFKPTIAFARLAKVDERTGEFWAVAAEEKTDKTREKFDYEKSYPHFIDLISAHEKATLGKSKVPLRSMHDAHISAGIIPDIEFDPLAKEVRIHGKVNDPVELAKLYAGNYAGVSIGGDYERDALGKIKYWEDPDEPGVKRYAAVPEEISLADNPAMYGATFTAIKNNGASELRKVAQGAEMDKKLKEHVTGMDGNEKHPHTNDGEKEMQDGKDGAHSHSHAHDGFAEHAHEHTGHDHKPTEAGKDGDTDKAAKAVKPGALKKAMTSLDDHMNEMDGHGTHPHKADGMEMVKDGADGKHSHAHEHDGYTMHDHSHAGHTHPNLANPAKMPMWGERAGKEEIPNIEGNGIPAATVPTGESNKDGEQPSPQDALPKNKPAGALGKASKEYSDEERKKLAAEGKAKPDGSYPIENADDLGRAIKSWGRGGATQSDKDWIIKRAKALKLTDGLPADWDGSTKAEKKSADKAVIIHSLKKLSKCYDGYGMVMAQAPSYAQGEQWDIARASDALNDLVDVMRHEVEEEEDADAKLLATTIAQISTFIQAEVAEMLASIGTNEMGEYGKSLPTGELQKSFDKIDDLKKALTVFVKQDELNEIIGGLRKSLTTKTDELEKAFKETGELSKKVTDLEGRLQVLEKLPEPMLPVLRVAQGRGEARPELSKDQANSELQKIYNDPNAPRDQREAAGRLLAVEEAKQIFRTGGKPFGGKPT